VDDWNSSGPAACCQAIDAVDQRESLVRRERGLLDEAALDVDVDEGGTGGDRRRRAWRMSLSNS
jgi:hypothetical protein